jgi:hypothetical protein
MVLTVPGAQGDGLGQRSVAVARASRPRLKAA